MVAIILTGVSLFFAGLLAGEEVVIRYGVRGPLASLATEPHIRFRQALIYRLRILVPSVFAAALVSGVAAAVAGRGGMARDLRVAGVAALLVFIVTTLTGTVPINQAALAWNPTAPPDDWRALVRRWEQLDTVRTWAAVAAFAMMLAAVSG